MLKNSFRLRTWLDIHNLDEYLSMLSKNNLLVYRGYPPPQQKNGFSDPFLLKIINSQPGKASIFFRECLLTLL